MIELRRKRQQKRRKGISKILITFGWKWNQIEITLFSYSKNTIYKNYYFDYIPELHEHLLYQNGTMKEKRRVFSEQIDYILNHPIIPINNDFDLSYKTNGHKKVLITLSST